MKELVRNRLGDATPKKLAIVGNGAVIDGWRPMIAAAMRSNRYSERKDLNYDDWARIIELIPPFAVHEYNLFRNVIVRELNNGLNSELKTTAVNRMADFFQLIDCIGEEYDSANLQFRKEIALLQDFCDEETGVITLNYDNSLWDFRGPSSEKLENIVHLHGRGCVPESLYFPSDSTLLDELGNVSLLIADEVQRNRFVEAINNSIREHLQGNGRVLVRRYRDLTLAFSEMHNLCLDWLTSAVEILIWGVALNPYDTELLSLISATAALEHVGRRLVIINPDTDAVEKTRLFFRVDPSHVRVISPH